MRGFYCFKLFKMYSGNSNLVKFSQRKLEITT